jgi:hypothetical protein
MIEEVKQDERTALSSKTSPLVELSDAVDNRKIFPFLGVRFIAVNDHYAASETRGLR